MSDLESLLRELEDLDRQHDLDGLRRVREEIVDGHPDSEAAVEALYKIGLDFLFRRRDLDAAVVRFADAAKRKHRFWSNAARTSLGLCYYHQRRVQKALFELRKVAYQEQPTAHTVTALTFIENIFETEGQLDELARVRGDRIAQLRKVLRDTTIPASERGYYLFSLGIALKDNGEEKAGQDALQKARSLGRDALGEDLFRSIDDACGA